MHRVYDDEYVIIAASRKHELTKDYNIKKRGMKIRRKKRRGSRNGRFIKPLSYTSLFILSFAL